MIRAGEAVEQISQSENGGDQNAPGPEQIAIQVLALQRAGGQYQMIQTHAGQGQGGHDEHATGPGKPGDIAKHRAVATGNHADAQGVIIWRGGGITGSGGPQDDRYAQCHQQEHQRQGPAGGDQGARVHVLGKGHIEHVWQHYGRDKERHDHGMPGAVLQGIVEPRQHFRMVIQPGIQA